MRVRRVHGVALIAAGAVLWFATSLASPFPIAPRELADRIGAEGSVDASKVRLAVYGGIAHSYDAARDETLMYVSWCNHSLCGPLVRVPGDLRGGEHRGHWLLVPRGERLAFVDAGEFEERNATFAQAREGGPAIDATFDIRSSLPPFFARLAAGAVTAAGIAIAARPRWTAVIPAILGPALASTVAIHTSYVILIQIGGFLGILVAALFAIGEALLKRRIPYVALAIALVAASAFALGLMALHYFPGDGGD